MDLILDFLNQFAGQLQSPTLAFLIGGALVAALGSKLAIPNPIYQFIVFVLLMKIGMKGGIEIREANLADMLLPALFSVVIGLLIVWIGDKVMARLPGIKREDGTATAGLFGAVSASTLAAAMVMLEEQNIPFEAWVPALYPFMDIPALLLGIALGLFARPDPVVESFYDPLFRGLLSILMLVLGMEAWSRLRELKDVAHWFAVYALLAPILHGLLAFGLGYLAHLWVGFSPGGVVLLSVIAASNSDISGPPTIRGGIPWANPSAYIGASTSVGTPVAIAICIPMYASLAEIVFGL